MIKFKWSYILFIIFIVSACAAKPSQEEFNKFAIENFPIELQKQSAGNSRVNDYLYLSKNRYYSGFNFLVVGNIEANDDEMFPYKGTIYYITYFGNKSNPSKRDSFIEKLSKMNKQELYNECKKLDYSKSNDWGYAVHEFLGVNLGMGGFESIHYKWGKKSKTWQKS